MGLKLNKEVKAAMKAVKKASEADHAKKKLIRNTPLPGPKMIQEMTASPSDYANPTHEPKGYATIEVQSSKGKVYKVTVPQSYTDDVPKIWSWNTQRLGVAEYLAQGIPIRQIAFMEGMPSYMTIYGWLQHPEFREHVDALVTETGFANQQQRIAMLNRLNQKLFDKLMNEVGEVKLTDKSVGAILSAIPTISKQVAQEKGELVESLKVEQDTKIQGNVTVATLSIDKVMSTMPDDKRAALEAEFDIVADQIIAGYQSDKLPSEEAKALEGKEE